VKSATEGPSRIEALVWPTGDYDKGDRHRQALDLLADILRVRLSLHLSTAARRSFPWWLSQLGSCPIALASSQSLQKAPRLMPLRFPG
jgi:hypothetical protein